MEILSMEQLLRYFDAIQLPNHPVQINRWKIVTHGPSFIRNCVRQHERGDEQGLLHLKQYKAALERLNEEKQ